MSKKLPATIYVKWDGADDGAFLNASADPSELSESEYTITVGRYELIQKVKLTNKTSVENCD